jgi:DEAD/DEAH box helicase domain-containing protein
VIVFMRSIQEVKQSTRNLRESLARSGRSDQAALVEEYYADKSDKGDVLLRLREGRLRCLFTTTALMAGIDVGSLDVAIVKGFPGLVMDARQMFGRAGRVREGAVIFIAHRTSPFDQFYFERPELLFSGPIEDVIANPENPILLAAHLQCAAQVTADYNREGPLSGEYAGLFGQMGRDILDSFVSSQRMRIQSGSYYLTGPDPHGNDPLKDVRAIANETYTLINAENDQLLENKRESTAFRDSHLNAIIWVGGRTYQVEAFDILARKINCHPIPQTDQRTRGIEQLQIEICSSDSQKPAGEIALSGEGVSFENGKIRITTSVQNYLLFKAHLVMQCRRRSCRYETPNLELHRCPVCNSPLYPKQAEELVDRYDIPVPPLLQRTLETRATWINLPTTIKNQFEQEFWPRWLVENENGKTSESLAPDYESAIHSSKHAILKAFPETILCDRDEIGGHYQLDAAVAAGAGTGIDRILIFDNLQGGLGLSDEFLYEPRLVLEEALAAIERCTCIDDVGCPVCLAYFNCHHYNQSTSKLAGRYLLSLLLGKDTRKVVDDLKEYIHVYINPSQVIASIDH